ncbi:MAG: Crp/Fnr family transcriptional regulator [Planctomycetota bacterium]|nr:Crp/Fnr family transcriptional regulator [Planctomycetota bacterium]
MQTDRTPPEKLQILATHWLLEGFDKEELQRIGRHVRLQRCTANEVIFRKGDPGLGMMAVLRGRVKIQVTSPGDREMVLNIIDEGQVFGEIALLDGMDRTADAVAMMPSELLVLDRRDFIPLLGRHPETCMKLIQVLCQRLRQTSEQLEDTVFLLQSARLGKTLLRLAKKYGQEIDHGIRIDLKLSQREFGTLVGIRREAMNRQLAEWREGGLISVAGGFITIPNLERFEEFIEELVWRSAE